MNVRFNIGELFCNYKGYFIIKPITLTLLFILTVFNSCKKDNDLPKVEGYVIDIFSNEKLDNAEIHIQELFHKNLLNGELEPWTIESGFTDANVHFQMNYSFDSKYSYALEISRDLYLKEDFYLPNPSTLKNFELFPEGFVKTHITNKIDTAHSIEIEFIPYYLSQSMKGKEGLVNCHLFLGAFSDTSLITTTIGGVMNNLNISIFGEWITDVREVKDTSFLTLPHDTVHLNIILF